MNEAIIILLLFSVFFVAMVILTLYLSFHGFSSGSNPASKEGSIIISNFKTGSAVFLQLEQDSKIMFNNFLATGQSVVLDWLKPHTIKYTISNNIEMTDVITSNEINVDKNTLVQVVVNPDGTFFELISVRSSTT